MRGTRSFCTKGICWKHFGHDERAIYGDHDLRAYVSMAVMRWVGEMGRYAIKLATIPNIA